MEKLYKDGFPSNNYINHLKTIDEKDLKFVEKDLAFYEKVSITFLLYGNDKINAQYALQNLIILHRSNENNSELLHNFTKMNDNWKLMLIEALLIIKSRKILRKLGFNIKELHVVFLPHIPEISLYINPILKSLYFMCEQLTPIEAGRIIFEIQKSNESAKSLRFYETRYFEIYLLDWITKLIIKIGHFSSSAIAKSTTTTTTEKNACKTEIDLSVLYSHLKLYEFSDIKEMLESAEKRLNENFEIRNKKQSKTVLNQNENDSALASGNDNFEKKDSYTINYDECYLIRKETAGLILIINQEDFYKDKNPEVQELLPKKDLPKRRGTVMDKVRLEELFSSFGYKSFVKDNLTNIQMLNEINDIVKRSEPFDSVIVCVLSHGIEGIVYGSNSVPVEIQKIQKILASELLVGKPKLLIIQACQGEDLQIAKMIKNFEYDSPTPSAPVFSDMLTATSTVPGFASIRHIEKGTWFIQTLCNLIDIQAERKHMLDILTSVNKEVSIKRGIENQCMVPHTSSTLSKSFYLPKRFK